MASKNTERKLEKEKAEQEKKNEITKQYLEELQALDAKYKRGLQPIIKTQPNGALSPSLVIIELPDITE